MSDVSVTTLHANETTVYCTKMRKRDEKQIIQNHERLEDFGVTTP